jgi:hypothetical protein
MSKKNELGNPFSDEEIAAERRRQERLRELRVFFQELNQARAEEHGATEAPSKEVLSFDPFEEIGHDQELTPEERDELNQRYPPRIEPRPSWLLMRDVIPKEGQPRLLPEQEEYDRLMRECRDYRVRRWLFAFAEQDDERVQGMIARAKEFYQRYLSQCISDAEEEYFELLDALVEAARMFPDSWRSQRGELSSLEYLSVEVYDQLISKQAAGFAWAFGTEDAKQFALERAIQLIRGYTMQCIRNFLDDPERSYMLDRGGIHKIAESIQRGVKAMLAQLDNLRDEAVCGGMDPAVIDAMVNWLGKQVKCDNLVRLIMAGIMSSERKAFYRTRYEYSGSPRQNLTAFLEERIRWGLSDLVDRKELKPREDLSLDEPVREGEETTLGDTLPDSQAQAEFERIELADLWETFKQQARLSPLKGRVMDYTIFSDLQDEAIAEALSKEFGRRISVDNVRYHRSDAKKRLKPTRARLLK